MPAAARKLPRSFYARETLLVAKDLLGMHLVHVGPAGRQVGRIVETEAYKGPQDLAAHSSRGRTRRTEVMFGPPGHAYVYFIYGFWNCLNVVTAVDGVPHAVLLRALEPIEGIADSTHGPGLLCRAMHIDRRLNGADLMDGELWIEKPQRYRPPRAARSPRIGVDYSGDWARKPWRFFDRDSPYVSTVSAAKRRALLRPTAKATHEMEPGRDRANGRLPGEPASDLTRSRRAATQRGAAEERSRGDPKPGRENPPTPMRARLLKKAGRS